MGELGVISVNSGTFVFLRRRGDLQTQHTQGGEWCKGLGRKGGLCPPLAALTPAGYLWS